MKKHNFKIIKIIKKCWNDISFKDKGLLLIMFILLLQCTHNLYNVDPVIQDYISINVVIRTSVAGIFGYFLSSSFLFKDDDVKEDPSVKERLDLLDIMLTDPEIQEKISTEYKCINISKVEKEIKKEEEIYICNKTLQDTVAIFICVFILLTFILGINFHLIPSGSTATLSQFRDLLSGCIGFLIGNRSTKNRDKTI
ncbi:hypothetical protein [Clostridium sp.]|uniref:hypothetical protein n=1 Tax=Clostridium sp. TaxID=1506 RepID=UPI003F2A6AEA